MKKALSSFLSLVLLLSLSANVFAADNPKVTVTAEKTAIHKSASVESEKLATVREGYTFTPVGSTKSFWKMEFKKKNDDTVYTGYILKEDTEEVVTTVKPNQKSSQSSNQTSSTSKSTSSASSTKSSSGSSNKSLSTVYWTPNGDVYHSIPNCRSLARSKTIRSGTIAESGKHKACRNCVR